MAPLSQDRNTPEAIGEVEAYPVLAATKIYAGSMTVLDSSGWAKPGVTATGLICVGRAQEQVDNTDGASGDAMVKVKRGVFRFANSAGGDAITKAEIGDNCYIVDDQTVAKTDGTGTRSIAGRIEQVDDQGVWVRMGSAPLAAPGGALLAANNLSDVGSAGTSRANLGVNKFWLQSHVADLVGATAAIFRMVAPRAGTITKFRSVLNAALATGNATLTLKINGVAVTNGVITITQAGSAAGDVDEATPSAANVVAAGDVISITVGGTNDDADATADAVVEITY